MRRLTSSAAAVIAAVLAAGSIVTFTATTTAQSPPEPTSSCDQPDPVEIGEDLWVAYNCEGLGPWKLAGDLCPEAQAAMHQAMYSLNNWENGAVFQTGEAFLFHPSDCPPPTTSTTTTSTSTTSTSTSSTTTTVAPTTTTTTPTTTSTTTTVPPTTTTSTTTLPPTTTTSTSTSTTSTTSTTTLPPTTTSTTSTTLPPTGCPAPANTPGGSDGRGGCFPGAHNTGVPDGTVLTNYTGPCTITAANTVIEAKTITCGGDLIIRAANVMIRRSHFIGGVSGGGITVSSGSVTIEDSWIDNRACKDCSVDGPGGPFTIVRSEVSGSNRGANCENGCTIRDSWFHTSQVLPNGAHASGIRLGRNSTIIHNTVHCDYPVPNDATDTGCSADLSGYPDFFAIHHNTIEYNLLIANRDGQSYCAYFGDAGGTAQWRNDPINATYIVVRYNVFQRGPNRVPPVGTGPGVCATYGPGTGYDSTGTGNQWVGNVYDDGTVIPASAVD